MLGKFQPDGTRSGWMNPMEAEGQDGSDQQGWSEFMRQERDLHGDVASAALRGLSVAGDVESEWSAVTVPTILGDTTPKMPSPVPEVDLEEKLPELRSGFDADFFDGDFFKEPDIPAGHFDLGSFPEEVQEAEVVEEHDFAESASC